jgi:hypothetical protein
MGWCELDWSGSGLEQAESSCELGIEPSGSKSVVKFLSDCTTAGLSSSAQLHKVSKQASEQANKRARKLGS